VNGVAPVPTSAPRPLRRDAAANKQRLLTAAHSVFARDGLDASVEEVARVAGVGMGTLYRRFPTKEALITELVHELLTDVARDARRALQPRDGQGLEAFLEAASAHQASQRGCLARLWGSSSAPDLLHEIDALIAALLVDAQAHGRIRTDVAASDIKVIMWSLRGVIETTQSVAPDAWRRHLAIVLDGLRPTSATLPDASLTKQQLDGIAQATEGALRRPSVTLTDA
jgi:AcrR family transcriptional regulator